MRCKTITLMKNIFTTLTILIFSFDLIAQIPQSSNLVGEYKFNGNTDDSSGNNYDGETFDDISDVNEEEEKNPNDNNDTSNYEVI